MQSRLIAILVAICLGVLVSLPAGAGAFRDRDCSDFKNRAEAQSFFKKHNPREDPHGLDADGDGKACESLPKR